MFVFVKEILKLLLLCVWIEDNSLGSLQDSLNTIMHKSRHFLLIYDRLISTINICFKATFFSRGIGTIILHSYNQ